MKKLCLCQVKFGEHDVREQVPVFAFLQCGLTNSKLAVLVSRYACSSGSGKRQDFTRSAGKTVNATHVDPSPPPTTPAPQSPNFTYPTQIVWFWVQPALQATTYVLRLHFGWVQMLSLGKWTVKFDDDVEQIQNLVYKEKLLYPCMTLFI